MKKRPVPLRTVGVLVAVLAGTALGQWREREVFLPDSLVGPSYVELALHNPVNNTIFLAGGRELLVLDAATGRRVGRTDLDGVIYALCHASDINKVYAAMSGGIAVLDGTGGRLLGQIPVADHYDRLCYNPTARKLYAVRSDYPQAQILILDALADTLIGYLPRPTRTDDLACHPDLNRLYIAAPRFEGVLVLDCAADTLLDSIWTGAGEFIMALHPGLNRLYIAEAGDEDIAVIHTGPDTLITYIWAWSPAGGLCLDPFRDRLYYSGLYDDILYIVDCRRDSIAAEITLPPGFAPGLLAHDPVADRLLCGGADSLLFFDCAADTILRLLPGPVEALAIAPSVRRGYAAGYSAGRRPTIQVLDLDAAGISELIRLDFRPAEIVLSPTGERLYCLDGYREDIAVLDADEPGLRGFIAVSDIRTPLLPFPALDRVYFGAGDSTLRAIDCTTDSVATLAGTAGRPSFIAANPTAGRILLGHSHGRQLLSYAAPGDTLVATIDLPARPVLIHSAPNSPLSLFLCADPPTLVVYDTAEDTILAVGPLPAEAADAARLPARNLVAVTCPADNTVIGLDEETGEPLDWLAVPGSPRRLLYHPRLDLLYCLSESPRRLTAIAGADFSLRYALDLPPDAALSYLDTLADRLVITTRNPPRAEYRDCADGRLLATLDLPAPPGPVVLDLSDRRAFLGLPGRSSILSTRDTSLTGIALDPNARALPAPGPTIIRGRLFLPQDIGAGHDRFRPGGTGSCPKPALLDITGRKVMELTPGDNDVRHLAPGVYFIRAQGPRGPRFEGSARKVVIQR